MTDQQAAALAANYRQDDPDAWDVARAVVGDARAFADLVGRLEARVYRFILRQVSADSAAEDLTQDTFLEVYRNLHRFQGASKFSTWVMGIALNLSRNYRTRHPSGATSSNPTTCSNATATRGRRRMRRPNSTRPSRRCARG
jgi:RNA polymerase sigma factor (sigma-70 family)